MSVDDHDDSVTTLREKRGQTIAQLLRSVGRVVIITLAVLLTFNVFINIAPILAGAGILGLAISFGAQSLVRDIISGFFILLENQFAVGDVIETAGKSGVVERMTMRVVVLRDLESGVEHRAIGSGIVSTIAPTVPCCCRGRRCASWAPVASARRWGGCAPVPACG